MKAPCLHEACRPEMHSASLEGYDDELLRQDAGDCLGRWPEACL